MVKEIEIRLSPKQYEGLTILDDKETTELLYGGAAGGGKSWLGCMWLIMNCERYRGSRWLLGRSELKTLKASTLLSFFDAAKKMGFIPGRDFRYKEQAGIIRWKGGSEIYLKDLKLYPTDPEFDSLGSTEYTGAFIDEASQITSKVRNVIQSRLRYKNQEFGIIPKTLYCSNPAKNFLYSDFFKPWQKKDEKIGKRFLPAFVDDNPYIDPNYKKQLLGLDKVTKERLLFGNWDYDDDPAILMDFDAINDLFTNNFVKSGEKYLISDLAMKGRDKFIITSWKGLRCKIELIKDKSGGKEIEEDLRKYSRMRSVPRSHTLVDSDGLGSYLESYMEDIVEFHGGSSAINNVEFMNLRSECYFKLAEMVNKRLMYIDCDDPTIKEMIIEELGQIKRDKIDNDESRKRVIKKETIKEMLGRSPDFADVLMMRMAFEIVDNDAEIVML